MHPNKSKILAVIREAERLELKNIHDFHQLDPGNGHRRLKDAATPKQARSGEFYLDCLKCGRSVIGGTLGTASSSGCAL